MAEMALALSVSRQIKFKEQEEEAKEGNHFTVRG